MTQVLVHISDLHFGREVTAVVNAVLEQLEQIQPDAVIISGDLTQRAKTAEFRRAQDFIQRIGPPTIIVPGNHDLSAHNITERFTHPWSKWHQFISNDSEPVFHADGFIAIGLNSARRMGLYLDWSRGRINEQQLDSVEQSLLDADEEKLRLLIVHHPFWLPPGHEKRELIGARDYAMRRLASANIDIILSGHVHIAYTQTLDGIIISHAGTSTSNRLQTGSHNSFNILRGNRQQLQIQTMEWRDNHFALAEEHRFKRTDGLWTASPDCKQFREQSHA